MTTETFHGTPVPLPVERFNQRAGESRADRIVRQTLAAAAGKAADLGDDELSEAFSQQLAAGPASASATLAPRGVDADRHALNQRVEAYMAEHGCDIDTAIRAVAGGRGGAPASVDADRHAMNQKVEEYLADHPDATMSDAISAIAGASR